MSGIRVRVKTLRHLFAQLYELTNSGQWVRMRVAEEQSSVRASHTEVTGFVARVS